MVSKIERQKSVANYLLNNPQASTEEISEALCITDRTARYIINAMLENGMAVRAKHNADGRCQRLSLSTWYADEIVDTPEHDPVHGEHRRKLETIAIQLERRGLWRRAATVWAELSRLQKTVTGIAIIAARRNDCIRTSRAG